MDEDRERSHLTSHATASRGAEAARPSRSVGKTGMLPAPTTAYPAGITSNLEGATMRRPPWKTST